MFGVFLVVGTNENAGCMICREQKLHNGIIRQGLLKRLVAVSLPAILLVSPLPAHAFELFGMKFFERGDTQESDDIIGTPQPYEVEVIVAGGDTEVEDRIRNASSLWRGRDRPASGGAGLIATARGDYRRLLDTHYALGRYGPSISITINGQEAAGLLPDEEFGPSARVVIQVDPGPEFAFSSARVENRAPPATSRRDRVEDANRDAFVSGEPARSGVILGTARTVVEEWRQQGYAKAGIAEQRIVAAHDTNTIDATLVVEPGRYATFGAVTVSGTERMDPQFVARQTGIVPGQEYDPDDLDRARDRLARLGVFRASRIEEAETIGPDGMLPLHLFVQERPLRRFSVGASYSTVDGLGMEAAWLHRNLFGRAESIRFEGKVAGVGETIDPKKFTYRAGATFTKPGIYTPDTDFVASLYGDREVLERYTRTGVTGQFGFTHQFTPEITARLFAVGTYNEFEDVFGTRDFVTAGLLGGLTYDSRDNPADATEGFYADLTVEPYHEFNYGNTAARIVAEARAYYSLDDDSRFVLAGRTKIGALLDPPIAETPPDKLFFAGGGGSVRGYAYRNVGVDTPAGVAGGRSLIEGSAEVRVRVTPTIGVVAFADAGYVGAEAFPDFSEDLRIGVGGGLRYLTGFGPIRLDVATPLDRRDGDPSVAVYVGIGQAF